MAASLSTRDLNVLEKIRDPESNPTSGALIDDSLPKDPHVVDEAAYDRLVQTEREIILSMQQVEFQLAGIKPKADPKTDLTAEYRNQIKKLGDLIEEQPNYASARNNRAQSLRRLYGDGILATGYVKDAEPILKGVTEVEQKQAGETALSDLDKAISLLTPKTLFAALSPQQTKTLALAHTQRAAIYHATSKLMSTGPLVIAEGRREAGWEKLGFEEAASRDFALGGRYGNEVAKGLAVSTNPTAKLCGQMVQEAMKKEYGPDLGL